VAPHGTPLALSLGRDQHEYDLNLRKFLEVFKLRTLSFNENNTVKYVSNLNVLGYRVQHKLIQPDPQPLKPLREFPLPQNKISLQRVLAMLAYYAKWIPKFFDKIKPLATAEFFPLNDEVHHFRRRHNSPICMALVWQRVVALHIIQPGMLKLSYITVSSGRQLHSH